MKIFSDGRKSSAIPSLVSCVVAAMSVCAMVAQAGTVTEIVDFDQVSQPVPPGWELAVNKKPDDVQVYSDQIGQVLRMFSNVASFALQKQMTDLNLKSTPILRWQWKVTKNPTGGDFRKKDDQAAQLIFGFTDKQFIAYIWDPKAPVGSELMTNHGVLPVRKVYVIVVRSGDADVGKWVTETRNVVEDYKRAFKAEVPVGKTKRHPTTNQQSAHRDSG